MPRSPRTTAGPADTQKEATMHTTTATGIAATCLRSARMQTADTAMHAARQGVRWQTKRPPGFSKAAIRPKPGNSGSEVSTRDINTRSN